MLVSVTKSNDKLIMLFHEASLSGGYNFCVTATQKENGGFTNQCYVHKLHDEQPSGRYSYSPRRKKYYTYEGKSYKIGAYKCIFNRKRLWESLQEVWDYAEYNRISNLNLDEVTGVYVTLMKTDEPSNVLAKVEPPEEEKEETQVTSSELSNLLSIGGL